MSGNREKIVAEIIANALSAAKSDGAYLLPAEQHRARARQLWKTNSTSRAAELHELAASAIEHRLGERAADRDAQGENCVSGISGGGTIANATNGSKISRASDTLEPRRFWSDDKLILTAILLVLVCWPLWPLVVLWTALLVGVRGVEKFIDWRQNQRRRADASESPQ
jgi:hypothetical protein